MQYAKGTLISFGVGRFNRREHIELRVGKRGESSKMFYKICMFNSK